MQVEKALGLLWTSCSWSWHFRKKSKKNELAKSFVIDSLPIHLYFYKEISTSSCPLISKFSLILAPSTCSWSRNGEGLMASCPHRPEKNGKKGQSRNGSRPTPAAHLSRSVIWGTQSPILSSLSDGGVRSQELDPGVWVPMWPLELMGQAGFCLHQDSFCYHLMSGHLS